MWLPAPPLANVVLPSVPNLLTVPCSTARHKFAYVLTLALFGPIVGLKTSSKGEGLFVTPHIGIVVLLVAAFIVGRFLIGLNSLRKKEINFIANITSSISRYMDNKGKHVAITGVLFAIVFPFLPFTDRYVLDVSIMILTYINRSPKFCNSDNKIFILVWSDLSQIHKLRTLTTVLKLFFRHMYTKRISAHNFFLVILVLVYLCMDYFASAPD